MELGIRKKIQWVLMEIIKRLFYSGLGFAFFDVVLREISKNTEK